MISIITIILNFFQKHWGTRTIKIHRFPSIRILHAHLLGLTIALLAILISIPLFYYPEISSSTSPGPYVSISFIILFLLGSYYFGGFYVLAVGIILILPHLNMPVFEAFYDMASWYIWGYIFGAIFAILYDDLIYLHTITVNRKLVKFHFAFDPDKIINIIKSPIPNEETVDTRDIVAQDKLYNYDLGDKWPEHPYTIVFVANPFIGDPIKGYTKDPIISNLNLFLRSVEAALASFEQDDVLGRPEIWSRIRIIAVFYPELLNLDDSMKSKVILVQPQIAKMDGQLAENLLEPEEEMWENFNEIMNQIEPRFPQKINEEEKAKIIAKINDAKSKIKEETDVIYALSASPLYTRSTAHFTDWSDQLHIQVNAPQGEPFEFDPDPHHNKTGEIEKRKIAASSVIKSVHEEYATFVPGRVALNVLGANSKTYIHEFGHAMTSALTGIITDEYFDKYEPVDGSADQNPAMNSDLCGGGRITSNVSIPFYINLLERVPTNTLIPVHKVFAKYNDVIYYSDRDHPSSEEDWDGYFPEKQPAYAGCMMDRTYGSYRFDTLISDFMYDRLIAKINRSTKKHPLKLTVPFKVDGLELNLYYFL